MQSVSTPAPAPSSDQTAPTPTPSAVQSVPAQSTTLSNAALSAVQSAPAWQPPAVESAGPSTQLLTVASSDRGKDMDLDALFGFNDELLPTIIHTKVFDPECSLSATTDILTDEEGISTFQVAAMSKANPKRYELPRTRSQSSVDNEEAASKSLKKFSVGNLVYARKGKTVPCWFPGIVKKRAKKGYSIQFLSNLGTEDCVTSNMMVYEDYTKHAKKDGKFDVPENLKVQFNEAQKEVLKMMSM